MQRIRSSEAGQVVIMFVVAMVLFGVMGAAVIDVGLLLADRRDAQSDVDRAALAARWRSRSTPTTPPRTNGRRTRRRGSGRRPDRATPDGHR